MNTFDVGSSILLEFLPNFVCMKSQSSSLLRKSFNTHNEAMKHEFYLEFDMDCRLFTHNSDIDISEHVLVQHTVFKTVYKTIIHTAT